MSKSAAGSANYGAWVLGIGIIAGLIFIPKWIRDNGYDEGARDGMAWMQLYDTTVGFCIERQTFNFERQKGYPASDRGDVMDGIGAACAEQTIKEIGKPPVGPKKVRDAEE